MMEQARRWSSYDQCISQGGQSQFLVQPVASCPADDPPSVEVEHHRQIQPALLRPDVGEISPPLLVWRGGGEVLIEPVGRDRESMLALGRAPEAPGLTGPEPVLPHQPRHASPPRRQALLAQFVRHARAAIRLV